MKQHAVAANQTAFWAALQQVHLWFGCPCANGSNWGTSNPLSFPFRCSARPVPKLRNASMRGSDTPASLHELRHFGTEFDCVELICNGLKHRGGVPPPGAAVRWHPSRRDLVGTSAAWRRTPACG